MLLFSQVFSIIMKSIQEEIEFVKDVLDEHKGEIESIKRKLVYLTQKADMLSEKLSKSEKQDTQQKPLQQPSEKTNTEILSLKSQLSLITKNLSELREAIGNNRNFQFPFQTSNPQQPQYPTSAQQAPSEQYQKPKEHDFVMDLERLQLLFILKQSKATSPPFAVSARQIKEAFSIEKTTRTLRNKLAVLVREGHVIKISKKPALYFLSQKGLNIINKQEKSVFSFTPQEY